MDPRHPEQAISRMRELMKQYDRIEKDMGKATTSAQLAQLEREGGLVVQEICLVAPRIHEAMMQTSRQRRHDLSRGNVYDQMREYAATAERAEEPVEKRRSEALAEIAKQTEKISEQVSEIVDTIAEKVKKPVEKSATQMRKEAISKKETTAKKKTTKKKTTKKNTKKAKE